MTLAHICGRMSSKDDRIHPALPLYVVFHLSAATHCCLKVFPRGRGEGVLVKLVIWYYKVIIWYSYIYIQCTANKIIRLRSTDTILKVMSSEMVQMETYWRNKDFFTVTVYHSQILFSYDLIFTFQQISLNRQAKMSTFLCGPPTGFYKAAVKNLIENYIGQMNQEESRVHPMNQ